MSFVKPCVSIPLGVAVVKLQDAGTSMEVSEPVSKPLLRIVCALML
jgi:hypothetical protein